MFDFHNLDKMFYKRPGLELLSSYVILCVKLANQKFKTLILKNNMAIDNVLFKIKISTSLHGALK